MSGLRFRVWGGGWGLGPLSGITLGMCKVVIMENGNNILLSRTLGDSTWGV